MNIKQAKVYASKMVEVCKKEIPFFKNDVDIWFLAPLDRNVSSEVIQRFNKLSSEKFEIEFEKVLDSIDPDRRCCSRDPKTLEQTFYEEWFQEREHDSWNERWSGKKCLYTVFN